MKKILSALIVFFPFVTEAQNLPLNAGASYPLSGSLYHSGNSYIRRSLTPTYFGYSNSYRVLMLGSASTTCTTQEEGSVTLSFGYDPSSNTNGSFTGDGRELLFRNGASFITPNAANNSFHLNNFVLKDGNVGIGASSPLDRLHLFTGPNPAYGTSGGITISDSYTVGRLWDSGGGHDIGTMDLSYDGSQTVRLIANGNSYINGGNVGIGTATPSSMLHLYNTNNTASINIQSAASHSLLNIHPGGSNNYSYINLGDGSSYGWQLGKDIDAGGIAGANGFYVYELTQGGHATRFAINKGGNIGIGTSAPSEKLAVNGNVKAKKVIVSQSGWPDYVFDSSYALRSLSEVEKFIAKNKHLPDIPSAKEVEGKGISVGDNQALLLKKIEEMTLYMIRMNKEIEQLKEENRKLKSK